jgi:aryl-alcohol dehydrogenase-like predicted oxidoreductase
MNPEGEIKVHKYLSPSAIRKEIEASLRRLKTDHVDLYQTHWQDATTPIEETMDELLKLKQEGKIRAIGVCNASSDQMREYAERGRLDSDQEKFSMLDRAIEEDQLPYCRQKGMSVLAYSPLALGLLTGKIEKNRRYGQGDLRTRNPRFSPEGLDRVQGLLNGLRGIAAGKEISLSQLVIAWTIAQPGLTHALVGARRQEQAIENAEAGRVELTEEELDAIDAVLAANPID